MTDDHSTVTGDEANKNPPALELSEMPDEARSLAKRYAEQEKGKLTESVRHTLVAFARDPEQGLKLMDEIDPKVSQRVLKELGVASVSELAKKTNGLSEQEIKNIFQAELQNSSVQSTRNSIEAKMAQLPDTIKEKAQQEFKDLTEGRTLTTEQLEKMADKAVNLARLETGVFEKNAKLSFSSQNLSSMNVEPKDGSDIIAETNHPFFSQFKTK